MDASNLPHWLIINRTVRVKVEVATRRTPRKGLTNWRVKPCQDADFIITARLHSDTHELIDYFLISAAELAGGPIYLKETNLERFAALRYKSLASMFGL